VADSVWMCAFMCECAAVCVWTCACVSMDASFSSAKNGKTHGRYNFWQGLLHWGLEAV
jgi:hypothetical protein